MLPFELTKNTPYLALSGELWSVFYEYFNRNWSCYKGFLLYRAVMLYRADYRFAPSQWETLNNAISTWLGANLESALL